jgi:Resolvase, N terminal domain
VLRAINGAEASAADQNYEGQIERLKAAGCEKVYSEKASGKSTNGRHELSKALKALNPGDTLIVVRLDRLARSFGTCSTCSTPSKLLRLISRRWKILGSIPRLRMVSLFSPLWAACMNSSES